MGELVHIQKILLLVGNIFLLGRMWMDVFIVTVNCRDWMKEKHLSTTDKILTLQGSSRICFGCTMIVWFILEKFCPWFVRIRYVFKVLMFNFWYFLSFNIWLTAALCSYYCVKIADFSHPFFIHLKLRLPGLESAWLLGSAILSLTTSLPFVCRNWEMQGNGNFPDFYKNPNVTDYTLLALRTHVLQGLGYFAAFGICAISAVLLVFSLWRHRRRMLGSWGGHRSPQTDAHFQAVISILSLLLNNIVVFICIQVLLSIDYEESSVYHLVVSVVLYSSFSVESLVSIWGNKKLKNELRRSLYFTCRGRVR